MFRDSFTAEPINMGLVPDDGDDLVELWNSIFDQGRSAQLVASQLQTDCYFRCGSIRQTELIGEHPMTQNKSVYFYQIGFIEEPWDQISHAADVGYLFDSEIYLTLSVPSDDFTKIVQDFFGAYIRGEGVMIDGVDASIQNGQYIHVVDEVKAVDLSDLDVVKTRCEVMFELGDDAFDSYPFCIGNV